jgi:hypothetical protein
LVNQMPGRLRDRVRIADRNQSGSAQWESDVHVGTDTPAERIRLWDTIDQSWSASLPINQAHYNLRKEVLRCSACTEVALFKGHIGRHIVGVRDRYEAHKNADPVHASGGNESCGGCGSEFSPGRQRAKRHIDQIKQAGPAHVGATELTVRRFALEPSVPEPVRSNGTEPVDIQVERSERKRSRHRNRRRRR